MGGDDLVILILNWPVGCCVFNFISLLSYWEFSHKGTLILNWPVVFLIFNAQLVGSRRNHRVSLAHQENFPLNNSPTRSSQKNSVFYQLMGSRRNHRVSLAHQENYPLNNSPTIWTLHDLLQNFMTFQGLSSPEYLSYIWFMTHGVLE